MTWSANRLVYQSPSGSVCECCHPTAVVNSEGVIGILFRNSLEGNRDTYLVQFYDSGATFGAAQKLGATSWKLNACPIDGGSLVLGPKNASLSVWRRGNLYLGPGRQPVVTQTSKRIFLACTESKSIRWKKTNEGNVHTLAEEGWFLSMVPLDDGGVLLAGERDGTVFVRALGR